MTHDDPSAFRERIAVLETRLEDYGERFGTVAERIRTDLSALVLRVDTRERGEDQALATRERDQRASRRYIISTFIAAGGFLIGAVGVIAALLA